MPYKDQSLRPLRDGGEFVYETSDSPEEVSQPGYFAPARPRLRRTDVIRIVANREGRRPAIATLVVVATGPQSVELRSLEDLERARIAGHAWRRIDSQHAAGPRAKGGRRKSAPAPSGKGEG